MQPESPKSPPQPEAWLRGPVSGVPPLLQPVAHALVQALEDVERAVADVPPEDLRTRTGGAASIGFHVRHAAGSLDRLFTYARGEQLTDAQRASLAAEKADVPEADERALVATFRSSVERALEQLRATDTATLLEHRAVGRAGTPSNVIGLLFHGGEHTARHVGQVITTARLIKGLRAASAS